MAPTARRAGVGNGSRVRRPKAHAAMGSVSTPLMAISLKAMPYGMT